MLACRYTSYSFSPGSANPSRLFSSKHREIFRPRILVLHASAAKCFKTGLGAWNRRFWAWPLKHTRGKQWMQRRALRERQQQFYLALPRGIIGVLCFVWHCRGSLRANRWRTRQVIPLENILTTPMSQNNYFSSHTRLKRYLLRLLDALVHIEPCLLLLLQVASGAWNSECFIPDLTINKNGGMCWKRPWNYGINSFTACFFACPIMLCTAEVMFLAFSLVVAID